MKFDERFLLEVKAHHRLSEYIGKTVTLKKSGREWTGLSPFSKERSPSFFVNDDKGFFHDFSSGKHGDLIDWLVESENLTFVEAVHRLAQEAGLQVPVRDEASAERERARRGLEDWLDMAGEWFEAQLRRPVGEEARAYLERRGLPESEWGRFGCGFAPDARTALKDHLIAKGAMPQALVETGLLIAPEDGGSPFDRFRGRVIFPIRDLQGRLVSFGGRALKAGERAKYLNGPETAIFEKGRHLYGLAESRKIVAKGGPLIVVEGYMDVIACQRAGIGGCAPMGTALTEHQLALLWRVSPEPALCFDADVAGRRAAARAMDMALPHLAPGKTLRFLTVAGGKDPDDVLREQGPDALRAQVSNGVGLAEALFKREVEVEPLDTPERRAALRDRLRKIVGRIEDRDLRREYGEDFRQRLDALLSRRAPAGAQQSAVDSAQALRQSMPGLTSAMVYWAVRDPARVADHLEAVAEYGFGDPQADQIGQAVVDWLMAHEADPEALAQHLHSCGLGPLLRDLKDPGGRFADPATWARVYVSRAEYLSLSRAIESLKNEIRTSADMQRFVALKGQRDAARRAL